MRILHVLLLAGLLYTLASAQVLDRVVAVVENEPILESELNAQIQFFVLNNKIDPNTPGLKDQVLQSMINEKLIVAKAIEDSVEVTDEEVQQQMDALIQQRVQQVGSEARLEELYGMPLSRIKREFRDELRKNLLAERLRQQRFGASQISRHEVEEFYREFNDSLGAVPEEVELSHIFIRPKPDSLSRAIARAKAQALLDSLKAGTDFAELAERHSEDPGSAARGGDLGLVRRGQFVKDFEAAVFALTEGQLSGIVETEFGFHLIQLVERRGDAVRARHILVKVERSQAGDAAATALLDSLRSRALAGESFAELAKRHSEDKETALIGGSLGTAEVEQLDKNFYATVAPLKDGEISPPTQLTVGNSYGYHIVLVKKRVPRHTMTLEQDYPRIEAIALNYRRAKEYQEWLDEIRKQIYWQSRL